jgi:hypothetical protein
MFKLPSLVKLPSHRTFDYQPRYYDPVKEDLRNRVKAAEAEMQAQKNQENSFRNGSALKGAFQKNRRFEHKKMDLSQMIFVVAFLGFFWLYYEFGNWAFAYLGGFLAAYIIYKRKKG